MMDIIDQTNDLADRLNEAAVANTRRPKVQCWCCGKMRNSDYDGLPICSCFQDLQDG